MSLRDEPCPRPAPADGPGGADARDTAGIPECVAYEERTKSLGPFHVCHSPGSWPKMKSPPVGFSLGVPCLAWLLLCAPYIVVALLLGVTPTTWGMSAIACLVGIGASVVEYRQSRGMFRHMPKRYELRFDAALGRCRCSTNRLRIKAFPYHMGILEGLVDVPVSPSLWFGTAAVSWRNWQRVTAALLGLILGAGITIATLSIPIGGPPVLGVLYCWAGWGVGTLVVGLWTPVRLRVSTATLEVIYYGNRTYRNRRVERFDLRSAQVAIDLPIKSIHVSDSGRSVGIDVHAVPRGDEFLREFILATVSTHSSVAFCDEDEEVV